MVMTKNEALKVLEIAQGATPEDIRSSYKKLALKWHPDKHNNSAESTKKFQEISEAYKRLTSKEDDDDISISMADMFDLFARIFFSNRGFFVNDSLFYSDDDDDDDLNDYYMMNASESSDDDTPVYRTRQHHAKYSDLMASRVSRSAAAEYRKQMRKQNNHTKPGISEAEALKNAEELIKEEEKLKKKAEKRKARKKRNRANRKQREKEQKTGGEEAENDTAENEEAHSRERRDSCKENENPTREQNATMNGDKTVDNKSEGEDDSDDNERTRDEIWDTSSAFFNHAAARRGPVNSASNHSTNNETTGTSAETFVNRNEQGAHASRGERQNTDEAQVDPLVVQSRHLAACGNSEANEGNYTKAIDYFTHAISLHNRDFRFFGNRSYCYDRLGEYTKALQDAEVTILLVPNWAKGYFRKGRALAGLKQYADAEKAFLQVLKLDKHCEDAKFELTRVRVQQLKDMGFGHGQSERAVRLYGTVHAALDALLSGKVKTLVANEDEMYVSDGEVDEQNNESRPKFAEPLAALWVGNIDPNQVTERQLTHLFSKFGTITLIRILPQSFCAFVNYDNKDSAARAMLALQGYIVGGQSITIRYPSNDKKPKNVDKTSKPSGPVNGNECYFWRTTGCAYGESCHYTHIPSHKGVDIDKVEQKYGRTKPPPPRRGR